MVVAPEILWIALGADELLVDLVLVFFQFLGQLRKTGLELLVLGLICHCLCPVHGEVKVTAAVIDLAQPPGGGPVVLQPLGVGRVHRSSEFDGLLVIHDVAQVPQRFGQGKKFSDGIPPEVSLFNDLLNVLGRGAAGAGLEKAATV